MLLTVVGHDAGSGVRRGAEAQGFSGSEYKRPTPVDTKEGF